MKQSKRPSWWGLYALVPLAVVLILAIAASRANQIIQDGMLLLVIVAIGTLALRWSEHHADLMGCEGVDAQAEEDALRAAGIDSGRFAPSLTATQANYRQAMLMTRTQLHPPPVGTTNGAADGDVAPKRADQSR